MDHYHRCSVLYSYSGSKRPIAIKTRGQLINRENAKKGVAARSIETRRNLPMLRCVIPIQQQSVTNHHNLFRFRKLMIQINLHIAVRKNYNDCIDRQRPVLDPQAHG